jgi:hypothetical protein
MTEEEILTFLWFAALLEPYSRYTDAELLVRWPLILLKV